MAEVLIRHRRTLVEYAVQESDFRHGDHAALDDGTPATYEEAGYAIVSYHPSGEPYKAPKAAESAKSGKAD